MAYQRKTRDAYEVQGNYGYGWECVTTEETWKEARETISCYRENEQGVPFRIKKVREKLTDAGMWV